MDNWLQSFNLKDASLDYIKINGAIIYSLIFFLTQPDFTGFSFRLIEEILLIIMSNNETSKVSALNSIFNTDWALIKINFINNFRKIKIHFFEEIINLKNRISIKNSVYDTEVFFIEWDIDFNDFFQDIKKLYGALSLIM